MSDALERTWNALTRDRAREFLRSSGYPAPGSREIAVDLVRERSRGRPVDVLDLGCGNGGLLEHLRGAGIRGRYVGVDFSEPLLEAARDAFRADGDTEFVRDNIETLGLVSGPFEVAIYSHVLEMLSCPEASLRQARELAKTILIRFYVPPEAKLDRTEIRELDAGDGTQHPFLRRTMSRDYYRLILARIGCSQVDVYRDPASAEQVHLLSFE